MKKYDSKLYFELKRKLLHLTSLWIPIAGILLPFNVTLIIFFIASLITIIFDASRLLPMKLIKPLRTILTTLKLDSLYRESEAAKFSGASYMMVSALITILIFPTNIFFMSFMVLIVADSIAAIIGIMYGKHKVSQSKTFEGSLAFFASAFLITIYPAIIGGFSITSVLISCLTTTLMELISEKLKTDDNLIIPITFGLTFILVNNLINAL